MSTIEEPTSIALRRKKLRPDWTPKATFIARRIASSTPVVPYSAVTTLMASAVSAVLSLCSACRSELSSGVTTEAGATSRR